VVVKILKFLTIAVFAANIFATNAKAFINQKQLDQVAQEEGFGYKTANLLELQNLVNSTLKSQLLKMGFNIQVPLFVGITSNQIHEILKNKDLDIDKLWQEIVASYVEQEKATQFLEQGRLPEDFIKASEVLGQKVEDVFESATEQDSFFSEKVEQFLNQAQKENWPLMVRSTGKEDRKELSNAGGNYTQINVNPQKADILRAMGTVVKSYLQKKSLLQRVKAKDVTIFDLPFTPGLMQKMVGQEDKDDKDIKNIPVGCVVYTKEATAKTKDISVIKCSFGHNEGVVNNKVNVDSFYVDSKGCFYGVVKVKTKRLIPTDSGLIAIENPSQIQNAMVIDEKVILAIKFVAQNIELHYGEPMDLELIYEPGSKTINLVQARPIPEVQNQIKPSYVSCEFIKELEQKNVLRCSTVGAAGGMVQRVTNKNQILIADTLNEALKIYNSNLKDFDAKVIKVVVVKKEAESMSHAAAIFRGDGIAILLKEDLGKLKTLVNQENIDLIVDSQQEVIIDISSKKLKNLFEVGVIKNGWTTHPLPEQISILQRSFKKSSNFSEFYPEKSLKDLIQILKKDSKANALKSLSSILFRIQHQIDQKAEKSFLEKFELVWSNAAYIAKNIEQSLDLPAYDVNRLYAINFLSAVLFQEKNSNIVNCFSFKSVLEEQERDKAFIEKQLLPLMSSGQVPKELLQKTPFFKYAKLGYTAAVTLEIKNSWLTFIDQIIKKATNQQKHNFIELMDDILSLDLMPEWLNNLFMQTYEDLAQDYIACLEELYTKFFKDKDLLAKIINKKKEIASFDLSGWERPDKYEQQLKNFDDNFLSFFLSDEFSSVSFDDKFVFSAFLQLLNKFIECFDKSIKTLKGSVQYACVEEKVYNFRQMVGRFLDFSRKNAELLLKKVNRKYNLVNYYENVMKVYAKASDKDRRELYPTDNFDVKDALILNILRGKNFSLGRLECLEDLNTLAHQNLLGVVSFVCELGKSEHVNDIKPPVIKNLESKFLPLVFPYAYSMQPEITQHDEKTVIRFNYHIVLQNHTLDLRLGYEVQNDILLIDIGLNVQAWGDRKTSLLEIVKFVNLLPELKNNSSDELIAGSAISHWRVALNNPIITYLPVYLSALLKVINGANGKDVLKRLEEVVNCTNKLDFLIGVFDCDKLMEYVGQDVCRFCIFSTLLDGFIKKGLIRQERIARLSELLFDLQDLTENYDLDKIKQAYDIQAILLTTGFNLLVKQNKGIKTAIVIAQMGQEDFRAQVHACSFNLIESIIKSGNIAAIEELSIFATKLIKNMDSVSRGFRILFSISEHGYSLEKATQIIIKLINSGEMIMIFMRNPSFMDGIEKSIDKFMFKGCSIEEIIKVAKQQAAKNHDFGYLLFLYLVKRGFAIKEAVNAIKQSPICGRFEAEIKNNLLQELVSRKLGGQELGDWLDGPHSGDPCCNFIQFMSEEFKC